MSVVLAACRTHPGGSFEADQPDTLLARWNAAVDATPGLTRDFHWTRLDQFPHPTYRSGDSAAYTGMADVLLTFYSTGNNLAFLLANDLLDEPFEYSSPSASHELTLRGFTRMLSTASLVAADRQEKLQALCAASPSPC